MIKTYENVHFVELDDQFAIYQNKKQIPNIFIDSGGIPAQFHHLVESAPTLYNQMSINATLYESLLQQTERLLAGQKDVSESDNTELVKALYKVIRTFDEGLRLVKTNTMSCLRIAEVGKYHAMRQAQDSEEI